jgi:hypothetical protein
VHFIEILPVFCPNLFAGFNLSGSICEISFARYVVAVEDALRRAFNLALMAGKLQKVPCFPHLKESAPRSGFVEEAAYDRLAKNAHELRQGRG